MLLQRIQTKWSVSIPAPTSGPRRRLCQRGGTALEWRWWVGRSMCVGARRDGTDTMIQLSVMTQNLTAGKSSQKCSPVEAGSVVYPWWSGKKSSTKKDPPHSAMSDCQANIPHAFWLSERLSGSYESHIHNSYIASLHYHDPWLFSCIQLTPFPFPLFYFKEQMSYQNTFINDSCFIVHVYVFMKILHCLFLKRILHEHYINI